MNGILASLDFMLEGGEKHFMMILVIIIPELELELCDSQLWFL